jgi:hypothetical protein
LTIIFTVFIFFLPMIPFHTTWMWNIMHFLSHILAVYISEIICVKKVEKSILLEFIFDIKREKQSYLNLNVIQEFANWAYDCFLTRPDFEKWIGDIRKGVSKWDLDLVFHALAPLCLKLVTILFVCRIWVAPKADYWIMCLVACRFVVLVVLQLPPWLKNSMVENLNRRQADFLQIDIVLAVLVVYWFSMGPVCTLTVVVLEALESWLYLMLGFLSLSIIMSDITVLERFGAFVFTLIRIARTDLPIFFTVYAIFLFLFAHAHYLGSNHLHAGIPEGVDSTWRIFRALFGQFEDNSVVSHHSCSSIIVGCTLSWFFMHMYPHIRVQKRENISSVNYFCCN